MTRGVVDTHILVSALRWPGSPPDAVLRARKGEWAGTADFSRGCGPGPRIADRALLSLPVKPQSTAKMPSCLPTLPLPVYRRRALDAPPLRPGDALQGLFLRTRPDSGGLARSFGFCTARGQA